MACIAALDEPPSAPPLTDADLAEMARQERALLRAIGFRQEPEPYGGWDNVVVDREAGWSRDTSLWGRLGGDIGDNFIAVSEPPLHLRLKHGLQSRWGPRRAVV